MYLIFSTIGPTYDDRYLDILVDMAAFLNPLYTIIYGPYLDPLLSILKSLVHILWTTWQDVLLLLLLS